MKKFIERYINEGKSIIESGDANLPKRVKNIDPPSGWKWGFPKTVTLEEYEKIKDLKEWCVQMGYPKSETDSLGESFYVRTFESFEILKKEKDKNKINGK